MTLIGVEYTVSLARYLSAIITYIDNTHLIVCTAYVYVLYYIQNQEIIIQNQKEGGAKKQYNKYCRNKYTLACIRIIINNSSKLYPIKYTDINRCTYINIIPKISYSTWVVHNFDNHPGGTFVENVYIERKKERHYYWID